MIPIVRVFIPAITSLPSSFLKKIPRFGTLFIARKQPIIASNTKKILPMLCIIGIKVLP